MRARLRDTRALAAGSAANGLLAYVFFVLATRALGPDAAAPVSVLWTYWSFAAAALTFPVQHWIARSVAAHRHEGEVYDALPRVAIAVLATAVVTGGLAWLGRHDLFHRGDLAFPALVLVVTVGSGFVGLVRGGLTARHRFGSVALALAAENGLRCVLAGVLIAVGSHSSVGFGTCLAVGASIGLLWPSALRFQQADAAPGDPERGAAAAASPLAFLGGAAGGQLIGQAVLTGGPVLLALTGGSARQVTALFVALALFRAPYTLALGLVAQLTGQLTRLVVEQQAEALRRFRLWVAAGTAGLLAVAAVVGVFVGPWLLPLVFGSSVRIDRLPSMLLALGSALALANLVTTIAIMAQSRGAAIVRAWLLGVLGGAVGFAVVTEDALLRSCWTFLFAEAIAFVALGFEEFRGAGRLLVAPET